MFHKSLQSMKSVGYYPSRISSYSNQVIICCVSDSPFNRIIMLLWYYILPWWIMFLYIPVLCFVKLPLLCYLCYPANLMLPMLLCCLRDADFFNSINFSVYYFVMILSIRVSGQGPWNFPYLNNQIIYKLIYLFTIHSIGIILIWLPISCISLF